MKAAVYKEQSVVEIAKIEQPYLHNKKGAIVKVAGCGLCGSDIVKIRRNLVEPGTVLGHEVVGIIQEIKTEHSTILKAGDKVAVAHHVPCFECRYCQHGSYSMCNTFKESYFEPGGFAEYIYISEEHLLNTTVKIPEGVNEIKASLMEPVACILRAIELASLRPDENILVTGLGFIGLLFVQVLKLKGYKVAGCDILKERVSLGQSIGADFAFNSSDFEVACDNLKNNGFRHIDTVFLASGANQSIALAIKSVRDGGKIIVFASISDNNLGFNNNDIYYRELIVRGAYSSAPEFLVAAMELLKDDKIKLDKYCETMQLDEINEAIDKTINHRTLKVYLKI